METSYNWEGCMPIMIVASIRYITIVYCVTLQDKHAKNRTAFRCQKASSGETKHEKDDAVNYSQNAAID